MEKLCNLSEVLWRKRDKSYYQDEDRLETVWREKLFYRGFILKLVWKLPGVNQIPDYNFTIKSR